MDNMLIMKKFWWPLVAPSPPRTHKEANKVSSFEI